MTPAADETPSLYSIDKKLSLLIQKVDSLAVDAVDHEKRIRDVEKSTSTMGVIFSVSGLAGIIALIKTIFRL